ncbi:galactinol--sucrose galactosyltransferase [Salvia divinorum]|uniref:Galactinol--sucrose galactosyltransferase n=1 Tax=Salvia divinorum TaxID=28513 RepID=A0ABD1G4U4_SALDI
MGLEENAPPAIVEKFRRLMRYAVVMDEIRDIVLIGWLPNRPNHDDLATEQMHKFGPGPNTRGMKDTHTRLHRVCSGNAPGWLLAGASARPEHELIGPLLSVKQQMYEGMPSNLESTGIELGAINEMLCEDYGGRVIASTVHCGDYWSMDPPDDPNDSSWLPGCHMLMGSFMQCHTVAEQVANKHLLKDLIQDVTAFEKQSHLSIAHGGLAVDGRVVPALGHYLPSHKVMVTTVRCAEIANKKAEGGRIEQANWDSSKKRGIVEAKAKEEAGKVLICMEPKTAASTNMASSCWDKIPKLLSASAKGVRRISLKKVLVVLLLVFKPQVASSSVNTYYYNLSAPLSPWTLNATPPPPLPPSRVTKRGARRLGPLSSTGSETEWGLPPKRRPPSCLPNC